MQKVAENATDLFAASLPEVLRIFHLRGNAPLEFSAVKIALQAAGIKARHPESDWGALSAALKESGVWEKVGMRQAVDRKRNAAKNGLYQLTPLWIEQARRMAEKRGWGLPLGDGKMAEQTVLVP